MPPQKQRTSTTEGVVTRGLRYLKPGAEEVRSIFGTHEAWDLFSREKKAVSS